MTRPLRGQIWRPYSLESRASGLEWREGGWPASSESFRESVYGLQEAWASVGSSILTSILVLYSGHGESIRYLK